MSDNLANMGLLTYDIKTKFAAHFSICLQTVSTFSLRRQRLSQVTEGSKIIEGASSSLCTLRHTLGILHCYDNEAFTGAGGLSNLRSLKFALLILIYKQTNTRVMSDPELTAICPETKAPLISFCNDQCPLNSNVHGNWSLVEFVFENFRRNNH